MSTLAQSLQDQINGVKDSYSTTSSLLQVGIKTAVSGQVGRQIMSHGHQCQLPWQLMA
jgi:hypothetical protein